MKKLFFILILIVFVCIFCVSCTEDSADINIDVDYNSNLSIDNISNNNIEIQYTLIPSEAYKANNIPNDTICAYIFSAIISADTLEDKTLYWDIFWCDPTITNDTDNYIIVERTSETTAKVICKKGFKVPLTLKITSTTNPNINASCNINYVLKEL